MSVIPEGDALRNAVKWISDMRQDAPGKPLRVLIQEACLKFNLSPKEAEYLANFYASVKD
jgi:hypothetical protein